MNLQCTAYTCKWFSLICVTLLLATSNGERATIFTQYRSNEIRNFSSMLIRDHEIFFGARNYVVKLDGRNFSEIYRMALLPDQNLEGPDENYVRIAPIGRESDAGDRFLSCETNSAESTCRMLPFTLVSPRGSDMQQMMVTDYSNDRTYTASAKDLLYNNVLLATQPLVRPPMGTNVDIYVGGPYGDTDLGLVRVPFGRDERKIDFPGSDWFTRGASFVAAFEFDGAVYYFLRENALEARVGANAVAPVYSRVARVCKADCGTEAYVSDIFTGYRWASMLKTRLRCAAVPRTLSGDQRQVIALAPIEFNYLHHVTFDESDNMFYATFTSFVPDMSDSPVSVDSAVCAFSRQAVIDGFSGQFLVDDGSRGGRFSWSVNRSSLAPSKCPTVSNESCPYIRDTRRVRRAVQSKNYGEQQLLIATTIEPATSQAILVAESTRFNLHATLFLSLNDARYSVLFILDFELILHKYIVQTPSTRTSDGQYVASASCHLETFDLGAAMGIADARYTTEYRPTAFRLFTDSGSDARWLVATFSDRTVRVSASDCAQYADEDTCMSSRDVLCGWNMSLHRCVPVPIDRFDDAGVRKTSLLQKFAANETDACRSTWQAPVAWSNWSQWQRCTQDNGDGQRSCECRTRECQPLKFTSWQPASTEEQSATSGIGSTVRNCDGSRIEVRNCAVPGGWSAWSAWSACPSKLRCRPAASFQRRTRTCTSPVPQFGGTPCDGESLEQRLCECTQASNNDSAVYSVWSPWQRTQIVQFSNFSQLCNDFFSQSYSMTLLSRTRTCDAEPPDATWQCQHLFESRLCLTITGAEEMCYLALPPTSPNGTSIKSSWLASDGTGSKFSSWGMWSACSGTCDSRWQLRARACTFPADFSNATATELEDQRMRFCDSPLLQSRSCSPIDCPFQSNLSTTTIPTGWSDWSVCYRDTSTTTVAGRVRHVRNRTRSCVLLRFAEQMPDLLALTGNDLDPYRAACPSGIATIEFSNCSVQPANNPGLLTGSKYPRPDGALQELHAESGAINIAANSGTMDLIPVVVACAIGFVIGLALSLLFSVLISRKAYRDNDATCARHAVTLLCRMPDSLDQDEKLKLSKPNGITVTSNPAFEVVRTTPSTVRRAALFRRNTDCGDQPPLLTASMRCDGDLGSSLLDSRINVPLPAAPNGSFIEGPSARSFRSGTTGSDIDRTITRTPKLQRNVHSPHQIAPQDGLPAAYTSSVYSSISSGDHDAQTANTTQPYRAPTSPLKNAPQPAELSSRLFVSSPLPPADHESMQRSTRRADPQSIQPNRGDLHTPTRFSKLANPSLAHAQPSPIRTTAPSFLSHSSTTDLQYAMPHSALGNADTIVVGNGTLSCGLHPQTLASTGMTTIPGTLRPSATAAGSQTPSTLTRHTFRPARAPSTGVDCEMDIDEQMRQITKQLMPDDDAV